MTSGKIKSYIVLSVAGAFVTLAPAQAVPVVPNFTQRLNDDTRRQPPK